MRDDSKWTKIVVNCHACQKPVKKYSWRLPEAKNHFCSKACRYGYMIGKNHPRYRGGFLNKQGYRVVSYQGRRILEHRLVMEQHLGRVLQPHEKIHHKNHIRHDNRFENLEVTDPSNHSHYHSTEMWTYRPKLDWDHIKTLHMQGHSTHAIAKIIGKSQGSIYAVIKRLGLKANFRIGKTARWVPNEQEQEALRLHSAGLSERKIAKQMELTRSHIRYWINKFIYHRIL